jgi:HK97 family phage major capsid protein
MAVIERTTVRTPEPDRSRLPGGLASLGFEVKTLDYGSHARPVIHTPTGLPYAPLEVFDGPYPVSDAKTARYMTRMRWSQRRDYKAAFWSWPSALRKANYNADLAFAMLPPDERKALSEGIDAGGGFLVPPDFLAEVMSAVAESSLMGLATIRPTTSDMLYVPRFLPNASSAYATQMTIVGGAGEMPARPSGMGTSPGFGILEVPIKRFRSIVTVTKDLLADADWALAFLRDAFARDLGVLISQWMLFGDGGILVNPSIVQANLQAGVAHSLDNSSDDRWRSGLKSALPEQYREKAVALMHGTLQSAYESETPGANGRAILVRHNDYGGGWLFDEVPLLTSNLMPAVPTTTTQPVLAYGDLQAGMVVANRADASMTIVTESVSADYDAVDVVFVARLGTGVSVPDAFRIGAI